MPAIVPKYPRLLSTATGEGYRADTYEDANMRVYFRGDADIDADGANGQAGRTVAYRSGDLGSEFLRNGGMGMSKGRVVFTQPWGKDIVFVGADGQPLVLPNGVVPSRTAYQLPPTEGLADWQRQLDSQTVPYIVVPSAIVTGVNGIVKGCRAAATYRGRTVICVVGDVGPRNKVGEISIALAEMLGIPSSPRTGGTDAVEVLYELWPGVFGEIPDVRSNVANATIGDKKPTKIIPLLGSKGTYRLPAIKAA